MTERDIEFKERYSDRLFTKWKGGRYKFHLYDREVDFFAWVFENKLENEIKFIKIDDDWSHKAYKIYFKTGETFIGFKLQWL